MEFNDLKNLYTLKKNFNIFIFYASQTGLSESVAYAFLQKIKKHKFSQKVNLDILNNFDNYEIQEGDLVFFFISTTNQGGYPSNSKIFYKNKNKNFNKFFFSILSFGDSSYENYCIAGKDAERILKKNDAIQFQKMCLIDDQKDDNDEISNWIEDTCNNVIKYRNKLFIWFTKSMSSS
jgi:sulfite reductase (NADPH) flavoprotein alpha-component